MPDSTGTTTTTCDALDRNQTVTNPADKTITTTYDALSQRASMTACVASLVVLVATISLCGDAIGEPKRGEPPVDVSRLVADLGSKSYRVRERATKRLMAMGRKTVDPLVTQADLDDPEVGRRVLRVLKELASHFDPDDEEAGIEGLERLAESGKKTVSVSAARALRIARTVPETRIRELGAKLVERSDPEGKKVVRVTMYAPVKRKELLKRMRSLGNLELVLSGSRIDDNSLSGLEYLRGLRSLDLRFTGIGDAAVKSAVKLKHLQRLYLSGTKVTDAGLAHLKSTPALTTLYLSNTAVTDAGLVSLRSISGLKTLSLTGTKVTNDGVAAMQRALPKCKIKH
jgi:YD repeat-containing protein